MAHGERSPISSDGQPPVAASAPEGTRAGFGVTARGGSQLRSLWRTRVFGIRRRPLATTGVQLYGAVVAAARDPFLYASLGVPDTLDGRFDLVSLYAFLLMHRLRADPPRGPELAQALFDAMFRNMEIALRELGVGDLSVPKRMRAMWEAFHGRALAYESALQAGEESPLEAAITRNIWRGQPNPAGSTQRLAHLVRTEAKHLAGQPLATLLAGNVTFLTPSAACTIDPS